MEKYWTNRKKNNDNYNYKKYELCIIRQYVVN
jgi:hypothetical protein